MPTPKPMWDDGPNIYTMWGIEEILVQGVRTVGSTLFDAWTKVLSTASNFFASHGITDQAFAADDSMSAARAKVLMALSADGTNLIEAQKTEIGTKIVNGLLAGGDAETFLGGLTTISEFKIINVPGLKNPATGNEVAGLTVPPSNGQPWTIFINAARLEKEQSDYGIHNWFVDGVLHELMHLATRNTLDHGSIPAGWTTAQWVADARTNASSPAHEWVTRMDALGNLLNLIDDTNRPYWNPIVVDLTGGGPDLVSKHDSHVSIDIGGTGTATSTGWIGSGQALIVADWNGNGKVDDGTEISFARFGTDRTSDLSGLASFDLNKDGKIDANDAVFAKLKMWVDKNHDGVSQPGELLSMEDAHVSSIDLHMRDYNTHVAGNVITHVVEVALAGGAKLQAYDVGFGI
jgi:hypothetical protein